MGTVPQEELRDDVVSVLRRAEAGERITVTVSGRPVAQLGPPQPGSWVRGADAADVWRTPAPAGLTEELEEHDDESSVRRPSDPPS